MNLLSLDMPCFAKYSMSCCPLQTYDWAAVAVVQYDLQVQWRYHVPHAMRVTSSREDRPEQWVACSHPSVNMPPIP